MRLLTIIFILLLLSGCNKEIPCGCVCSKCGIECRNHCEGIRCIPGEPCCNKCICPKNKPLKK